MKFVLLVNIKIPTNFLKLLSCSTKLNMKFVLLINLKIPTMFLNLKLLTVGIFITSDLIIPGLVTNGTAQICCRDLILALFDSTKVIKKYFG